MKVAINGFGRIGRTLFRQLIEAGGFDIVAVNDLVPADDLAYALRFDSVRGRYPGKVGVADDRLVASGQSCAILMERDPGMLPWRDLGVELVFECTGRFTGEADLGRHLTAGAGFVILSAPAGSEDVPTLAHGVNAAGGGRLVSCASCTTNAIAPVMEVLQRRFGVLKAAMTTVHAYTADQSIVDTPRSNRRRGRAAAANLVPSTTGAARATALTVPELAGRFDGLAIRAPVAAGSIADITCLLADRTSLAGVNAVFRQEAVSERYSGILGVSDEEMVSSDILGDPRAAVVDLTLTQLIDGDLVKVFSWYDNEWGYCAQLVRVAQDLAAGLAV
ncbi:MAG TPA: glyceraldehyde 3-phosphate dehydrogenase NAD-binding domain-containing protein [Allosphingosinicella sp.]|jgi:glyceraldehyde 3-phosphate dehydrogenase